jgi:hypothetical protein
MTDDATSITNFPTSCGCSNCNEYSQVDGEDYLLEAEVDTGAQVSLLPMRLTEILDYQTINETEITIDQAGIGKQAFSATKAYVTLSLEDLEGNQTKQFQARVWFADTNVVLLGFADILDRTVLSLICLSALAGLISTLINPN